MRQAADHQHQAGGAQRCCFVDGPLVVVDRGLPPGRIGGRKHAAAAIAADSEPIILDRAHRLAKSDRRDLIAPRIDRGDAVTPAGVGRLAQIPLLAHGGEIDGQACVGHLQIRRV